MFEDNFLRIKLESVGMPPAGSVVVNVGEPSRKGGIMDNPVLANAQIGLAICAYATCSSTMLVINKLAVHFLPAPAIVLFFQLLSSAVAVFAADKAGLVKSDKLEWSKARTLANWLNCDAHSTPQRWCLAQPRYARLSSADTLTRPAEGGRRSPNASQVHSTRGGVAGRDGGPPGQTLTSSKSALLSCGVQMGGWLEPQRDSASIVQGGILHRPVSGWAALRRAGMRRTC